MNYKERLILQTGAVATAGFALFGADQLKTNHNLAYSAPINPNPAHSREYQQNIENVICTDPARDEHPAWVDFTKVTWEQVGYQVKFKFTLTGDPRGQNTQLKTDGSYAIVFVDPQTRLATHYAYAFGGQRTAEIGVAVRAFSAPRTGFDEDINTIPNPGARNDSSLHQSGPEAIETTANSITFNIPASLFDALRVGKKLAPWTTEGTGHGNEDRNGIQSFNKDHCILEQATPTPTVTSTATATNTPTSTSTAELTSTPTATPTPTQTPQPSMGPTQIPTEITRIQPSPTVEVKKLPPTGTGPDNNSSPVNKTATAAGIGTILLGAGAALLRARRRNPS